MIQSFRKILFPIGLTSFVLATLSWDGGHPTALPPPVGYVLSKDNENEVYIEAKVLSIEESRDYIHRDLVSHGYQPILLQIDNTSPFSYDLKKQNLDVETTSTQTIVDNLNESSLPRKITYKILGFFLWPFMIPGTIDAIRSKNKAFILQRDLEAKTLKIEGEIIPPYSSVSRVLYVPKDEVKDSFQLSLSNIEKNKIETFSILIETSSS